MENFKEINEIERLKNEGSNISSQIGSLLASKRKAEKINNINELNEIDQEIKTLRNKLYDLKVKIEFASMNMEGEENDRHKDNKRK